MLYEISRKSICISKYVETNIEWHGDTLTLLGNKHLRLFNFSYNLNSLEKEIDLIDCAVSSSTNSPIPKQFLQSYASRGLKNIEMIEMALNPAFWPHNDKIMQEMSIISATAWSPDNFIVNNNKVLAALNCVGNVDFYALQRYGWNDVYNFSSEITNHFSSNVEKLKQYPKEFENMLNLSNDLVTTSISWAPNLNTDNSCYFITAQKSGVVLFWRVKHEQVGFQTELCGSVKADNVVSSMIWIPIADDKILLVCSDVHGQLNAYELKIEKKKIVLIKEHLLWSHKDKMIVKYYVYRFLLKNKLLLVFNKNRHLVLQLYDENMKLVSENVKNVNDFKITCIKSNNNHIYVSTLNAEMYKVSWTYANDTLDVNYELIKLKDFYPNYELHGICFSENKTLVAIAVIDRKLLLRKESLKFEIVFLSYENGFENEVSSLLNNPTKRLTGKWDYIEALRVKLRKAKKFPKIDENALLENNTDIYNLRVFLIFLTLYNNLEKLAFPDVKNAIQKVSIETIKERILVSHASELTDKLYKKYEKSKELTDFEWECFVGAKSYIQFYCKKNDKNIAEFIPNIPEITKSFEYTCQACEDKIENFSCQSGHFNMFCSPTFTPIESTDYLCCQTCDATARFELYEQNVTCVFCDLYLNNNSFIIPR